MRGSKADMETTMEEGGAAIREAVWGDMHVSFESFKEAFDAAPFHKGCPNDRCQCPHWGYVLKGEVRINYPDHDEVLRAGDAYYLSLYASTQALGIAPVSWRRDTCLSASTIRRALIGRFGWQAPR